MKLEDQSSGQLSLQIIQGPLLDQVSQVMSYFECALEDVIYVSLVV